MSKKHKKLCTVLHHIKHLLILAATVTRCFFISPIASSVHIPVGIESSPVGRKTCTIIARIKRYKSLIKKMKKNHDRIVILAKTKLNTIEVLISNALIDSCISHNEFIPVNNVLREYDDMKEEIQNLKTSTVKLKKLIYL